MLLVDEAAFELFPEPPALVAVDEGEVAAEVAAVRLASSTKLAKLLGPLSTALIAKTIPAPQ